MNDSTPLAALTEQLARLPGLGNRSAERIALALARRDDLTDQLLVRLKDVRENVCCCRWCGAVTRSDQNPCPLCTDPGRNHLLLCVVEEPRDILAIERSGGYQGRYHALMGRISPARKNTPADIRLQSLLDRVRTEPMDEVILALGTDMEGEANALLITELLHKEGVKVSHLALGLPTDSGVGFSDPLTLKRAFGGRYNV